MVDREQWMRDNRFKGTAKLLWDELKALGVDFPEHVYDPNNELEQDAQTLIAQRLYDIILYTLNASGKRYLEVYKQRLEGMWQGEGAIYVDVPDLKQWPDSSHE